MFSQVVYILFATLLVVQSSHAGIAKVKPMKTFVSPYTLWDQAYEKLQELTMIVDTAILTANAQLGSARTVHINYADQVSAKAETEIQDEAEKNDGLVNDMVNLALSASVDPSGCLRAFQPLLNRALTSSLSSLQSCITDVGKRVDNNIDDAQRQVAATKSNVNNVDAQLHACVTGSILCVSPVVRLIDTYKIELPEAIESEVHKATGLIENVSLDVDGCSSSSITDYITDSTGAMQDLEGCIEFILS